MKLNSALVALFASCALACQGTSVAGVGGGSGGGTAGGSGGGSAGGSSGGAGGGAAGGSAGGSGGSSGSVATFCASYEQAFATVFSQCLGGSVANWEASSFTDAACAEVQAAVDAGRVAFNSNQSSACITAIQDLSCSGFSLTDLTPSACLSSLTGTVAVGGSCYSSLECAGSATYCAMPSSTACQGTCANQIAIGQSCNLAGCVSGASCVNSVCTANPARPATVGVGQTCGYIQVQSQVVECNADLSCDPITKQCAAIIRQGNFCTPGHELCESFTYCDSSLNTCQPWPSVAGAACGQLNGQVEYVGCIVGSCNVTSGTAGTCVANPAPTCTQD